MIGQEQGLGEEINILDSLDGDVQLIEAPTLDQPKFIYPTKKIQGMTTTPTILSYLSKLVSKK